MRYVILKVEDAELGITRAYPIIFPQMLVHSDVFKLMQMQIFRDTGKEAKLHSAGTFSLSSHDKCARGSETLKVPLAHEYSREDELLIFLNDSTAGII